MSRIRPRIDSIASTWPDSAWLTFTAWLGLVAGAGGDAGGDFDFGPGVLDGADQAGGGLRRFAHRDRRLLGGGGDFAGLAEHAAGRRGGGAGALGQRPRLARCWRGRVGDAALELLALAAARVGGLIGLEQRDLGEDDVGFVGWSAAGSEVTHSQQRCRARRRSCSNMPAMMRLISWSRLAI